MHCVRYTLTQVLHVLHHHFGGILTRLKWERLLLCQEASMWSLKRLPLEPMHRPNKHSVLDRKIQRSKTAQDEAWKGSQGVCSWRLASG
jgi:hypothetical protein